jgi:ceramide glucosyltransferase
MILSAILGSVAVLSAGINIWQWIAACRFPLHQRTGKRNFTPGVTLFKPLKGVDSETSACLESWLKQDYRGPVQILFGVADARDAVCEVVRVLRKQYADREIELVICDPILGANAKVSTLTYLEPKAKYPIWVISDADVFAPSDLLAEMIQKFEINDFRRRRGDESSENKDIALVNCFYKLSAAKTGAMIWENIGVNADFWSQVCQNNSMKPMNFALGAVMAVRDEAVDRIGGFRSLLNQLADDYQLGRRIADRGWKIELANVVVECRESPKSFSEVFSHQLRWSRTIRVCQPGPYFASILSNLTLWMCVWYAFTASEAAFLCLPVRIFTALHNDKRLTQTKFAWLESFYAPAKDLLQFVVWLSAFAGNVVVWRGEKFLVNRGGELIKVQG